MRGVRLALIAGLGLALGCKQDSDSQPDNDQREQHEQPPLRFEPEAAAVATAPRAPHTLTLVDAGAEPRRELRYAGEAPARRLRLTSRTPAIEQEGDAPGLTLVLDWRGVAAEGEQRRYLFEVTGVRSGFVDRLTTRGIPAADADDQPGLERMKAVGEALERMYEGAAGQAHGGAQGLEQIARTRGVELNPEPVLMLELFAVPLPREAIGVGASWTSSVRFDQNAPEHPGGMRALLRPGRKPVWVSVTRSYRLRALDGERMTIEYRAEGTTGEHLRESWHGELELRLDDPLAVRGRLVASYGNPAAEQGEADGEKPDLEQILELETLASE